MSIDVNDWRFVIWFVVAVICFVIAAICFGMSLHDYHEHSDEQDAINVRDTALAMLLSPFWPLVALWFIFRWVPKLSKLTHKALRQARSARAES